MKYRAEIDGLRALAVVPVILFHAGFDTFSGGFVGVDVFFVISGYLITTILIEDIENNRFSIAHFYQRRARRILPALFFVMLFCIPFAWIWMLPNQAKEFSHSLIAVSLFVSNMLFWRESGYFAEASEEKPLLHTWSLAVEEQYYVLFPIFLIFVWRFGRNRVFWMIVVFASISLLLSEWGSRNTPEANFYLAPTRAWELLAGSIAAFVVQRRGVQANNALSLIGLAAIAIAIFAYDETTPFPSFYSLVPVVGVVLLVLFASTETLAAKFLSAKAFVGVGLISYSAYLWHQPLFAFARLRLHEEPSIYLMGALSVISLLLAVFSFAYIEKPFRSRDGVFNSRKTALTSSAIGLMFFVALGWFGNFSNGVEGRFNTSELDFLRTAKSSPLRSQCHFSREESSLSKQNCTYQTGKASVAVVGNSHATELAYALAKELERAKLAINHHTMSGCRHNFGKEDELESICQRWHQKVIAQLVEDPLVETVVISYRNDEYLTNSLYRQSLVEMIDQLLANDKRVIYVLQAPLPGRHINKHIKKYLREELVSQKPDVTGISVNEWRGIYEGKSELLDELPNNLEVIDPQDSFCITNRCSVIRNGEALYFDDDHMSVYGAAIIAKDIADRVVSYE